MTVDWTDAVLYDMETKQNYRVIERYVLPGKNTGSVLVCSDRQVYWQFRFMIEWLTELPESIHYEDRKNVIKFCEEFMKVLDEECWDIAVGKKEKHESGWYKRYARRLRDDEDTCGK